MIVTLAIYDLFIYFSYDIQHLEKSFSLWKKPNKLPSGQEHLPGTQDPWVYDLGQSIHWIWNNNLCLFPPRAAAASEARVERSFGKAEAHSGPRDRVHLQGGFCCREWRWPRPPAPYRRWGDVHWPVPGLGWDLKKCSQWLSLESEALPLQRSGVPTAFSRLVI